MTGDSKPHDAFFKALFGRPGVAADLLRRVLPPALSEALDLDRLEPVSPELIDEELHRTLADLVFRAPLHDREVLVFFLLEHQRRPDLMMPWRLLVYMVRLWQRWIAARTEEDGQAPSFLPPILPVVVHNGARPWTRGRRLSELIRLDPPLLDAVRPYLPELHLLIDDLPAADDATLTRRQASPLATIATLFLKHGPQASPIEPKISRWLDHLQRALQQPGGPDALMVAMRYLFEVNESIEPSRLGDLLTTRLTPQTKELIMTAGQRLREEGREEGRAEGLVQGRELEGRALILKQLKMRFRAVPDALVARVEAGGLDEVEIWAERILVADRLEDVFAP